MADSQYFQYYVVQYFYQSRFNLYSCSSSMNELGPYKALTVQLGPAILLVLLNIKLDLGKNR